MSKFKWSNAKKINNFRVRLKNGTSDQENVDNVIQKARDESVKKEGIFKTPICSTCNALMVTRRNKVNKELFFRLQKLSSMQKHYFA